MDNIEGQIFAIEQNLAKEQQKLRELREELDRKKREEETSKYDKYKEKLCLFWDNEGMDRTTLHMVPIRSMIRPFHHVERRQAEHYTGREELRYYAGDWYTGDEIGHGWKHMRPVTLEELKDFILDADSEDCSI
jgi:hypothetical protein